MADLPDLAPRPAYKVGTILHVHQRAGAKAEETPCIPAVLWALVDGAASVTLLAYGMSGQQVAGLAHDPHPGQGIILLGMAVAPTWHGADECPWSR